MSINRVIVATALVAAVGLTGCVSRAASTGVLDATCLAKQTARLSGSG